MELRRSLEAAGKTELISVANTSQPIELEQGTNPKQTLTGTNKYSYIKTVLTLLQS